ncbi:RNA polymerase, sigma-24 subunit, ECF subfamily [Thiomonas sp. X19]|nr:RNA polymerase, sigma-24 subunit, ECF subfamily [Thiomonas sp. X19]
MSHAFTLTLDDVSQEPALDRFCLEVRPRALRLALLETAGNSHLAADLVQDSLAKLVSNYRDKPAEEWAPLFYSILRNRITDWHRRKKIEKVFDFFFASDDDDESAPAPWESLADPGPGPDHQLGNLQLAGRIADAIGKLSARQREAFMLREMEGLSIADTAKAMHVSEGSVKTHHLRALTRLRNVLQSDNPLTGGISS